MLYGLSGVSFLAVLASLLLHVGSFAVPINSNPLHLSSCVLLFILFAGSIYAVPRRYTVTDSSSVGVPFSTYRVVPWWLFAPFFPLAVYAVVGFRVHFPALHQFSVVDMSPDLARWACVFEALFFYGAAVTFYAAAKLQRMPVETP